jgi:5-hydroxyisourate hydrolase
MSEAKHISISSHVLDTAVGRPAGGIHVTIERQTNPGSFDLIGKHVTDTDGRIKNLPPLQALGVYRVTWDTATYYAARNQKCFYPNVVVTFEVTAYEHHHIPLLLSPFGYSTYRGS